jgi:hypothetical protein
MSRPQRRKVTPPVYRDISLTPARPPQVLQRQSPSRGETGNNLSRAYYVDVSRGEVWGKIPILRREFAEIGHSRKRKVT